MDNKTIPPAETLPLVQNVFKVTHRLVRSKNKVENIFFLVSCFSGYVSLKVMKIEFWFSSLGPLQPKNWFFLGGGGRECNARFCWLTWPTCFVIPEKIQTRWKPIKGLGMATSRVFGGGRQNGAHARALVSSDISRHRSAYDRRELVLDTKMNLKNKRMRRLATEERRPNTCSTSLEEETARHGMQKREKDQGKQHLCCSNRTSPSSSTPFAPTSGEESEEADSSSSSRKAAKSSLLLEEWKEDSAKLIPTKSPPLKMDRRPKIEGL